MKVRLRRGVAGGQRCLLGALVPVVVALLGAAGAGTASAALSPGVFGGNLTMATAALAPSASSGVAAWGWNSDGRLGVGTSNGASVLPVAVSGLSGVTAVAAGGDFGLALLTNGSVMSWGANEFGQLGNGTTTESAVPVQVSGLSGAKAIAAGEDFALALLSNGTVMAWGENFNDQLGTGSTEHFSDVPVPVGELSNVVAISAGGAFSLAVQSNGSVKAWGDGFGGVLGNGTTETLTRTPVAVSGLSSAKAVAAGGVFGMALLSNGSVMAWGVNETGDLGNGTKTKSTVPVQVSGLSGVTAIAAGYAHGLAVLGNGSVSSWGAGDLGNGTTENSDVPVTVSNVSGATSVAAASSHSLALLSNGTVMAWGENLFGQLGNGTATSSTLPVLASTSGATAVAAGREWSMALGGSATSLPVAISIEPNSGPTTGGTVVTISGTNLTGATAVKFGSTNAASFTVNSASSITAVSPPGTGTVDVSVTTPEGTSPTSSGPTFSYFVPVPTVTKVEPSTGPAAGGTSVTITGTNLTGATAVKFGSTTATSFTVNSASSITAISPAGTGTVDVTVTTPEGTSATGSSDRFSYVSGPPTVTNVIPRSGTHLGGTSVTIIGTNLAGATAVKFGSASTSFTVNSDTMITATSPSGPPGPVDVTVTTPQGTSPTGEVDKFGYLSECEEGHEPAVTSVTPNSGPSGTSVLIKGVRFFQVVCTSIGSSVRRVLFGDQEATFKGGEHEGEIIAVAPPGSGTVDVRVEGQVTGASPVSPGDQFTYASAPPPVPAVSKVEANHGPAAGGTSVTITGTNLTGATAVKFGSRNASSFTVNSETSITAVAPPWGSGDGVAEVTVTTPAGTSALSLSDSFVYEPTVTKVEPSSGPPRGGTSVTISGAAFEGVYTNGSGERPPFVKSVKFGSTNATSFKVEPEGRISAVAPPGTGTVDLTVTTEGGTSPVGSADRFTFVPPTIQQELTNWVISGALEIGKLNQEITLPEGSRFNGTASINLETQSGPISGTITVPPFNANVKILGLPATVGMEFTQVGSIEGSIGPGTTTPGDFSLSLPAKANIGFSSITIFGLKIATKCVTSEPLALNLLDTLPLEELLLSGAHFMGTTKVPTVKCEGTNGTLVSQILTSLFSGPSNPYSITLAP